MLKEGARLGYRGCGCWLHILWELDLCQSIGPSGGQTLDFNGVGVGDCESRPSLSVLAGVWVKLQRVEGMYMCVWGC